MFRFPVSTEHQEMSVLQNPVSTEQFLTENELRTVFLRRVLQSVCMNALLCFPKKKKKVVSFPSSIQRRRGFLMVLVFCPPVLMYVEERRGLQCACRRFKIV